MKRNVVISALIVSLSGFIALFASCHTSPKAVATNNREISKDSAAIIMLFDSAKINKHYSAVYIKQASDIAAGNNRAAIQPIYLALLGKTYIYSGQLDAADSIADKGLQLAYKRDTVLKGKFYNIKGNVAGLKKNIYQSIEYYLSAEKIFATAGDSASLAGIYSNIANSYFSLKDYSSAHIYAVKAYHLLPSVKEVSIASNIITTHALALNKVDKSREALLMVKKADSLADTTQNKMAKLAATIGLAEVYNTRRHFDTATAYYQKCIDLSKTLGVKHFELMSLMGLMAMNEELGNNQELLKLSVTTIALANQLKNKDVLHTAKRLAGKALGKLGKYRKGFALLDQSYALYDSVAGVENQKNINELLVKYGSEKKEKEILNQNLLLAKQKIDLRNRQGIILGLVMSLAILSLIIFSLHRLNKERLLRMEAEKQKKISNAYIHGEQRERTRLAFEIHDGIASMLTGISYKLRAGDVPREEVLNLLTALHEDTRRISHSLMPIDFERKNFVEVIENLCEKISTTEIEVLCSMNIRQIDLDTNKSLLLYRIIQELINNAFKYAQCRSIFVRMTYSRQSFQVIVEDDGIGVERSLIDKGFRSVKERVSALHGVVTIDTVMHEGTIIKITCPNE